ncbi:MAG: hypothetical protein V4642_13705 [Bacteroidota bacterium]
MNHLSDIELLEYLDGENPAAHAHVQTCADCQSNLAVFKNLAETASHSALERTSGQFTSLIMAEVLKPEEKVVKAELPRFLTIGILAAAACVIILVALNFGSITPVISNVKLNTAEGNISFDYVTAKTSSAVSGMNSFFRNPAVIMLSLAAIVMSVLVGFEKMISERIRKF